MRELLQDLHLRRATRRIVDVEDALRPGQRGQTNVEFGDSMAVGNVWQLLMAHSFGVGTMTSELWNDAQTSDLAHLVDVLADMIAKDYGDLDPQHFRGAVEDVLVALAALGLDPGTIRRYAGPHPDTRQ